ncbi:MAG: DsbA family protein [Alphaproteobacteria bacterium]
MIIRRDALAVLGLAMAGLAMPALPLAAGETPGEGEMVLGVADAPVTIIEYASLTCPHCASFHSDTLPLIKERYIDTGKARLVFRDFPFDRPGLLAAAMARCAGPERFFGFLEVLFRSQKSWSRATKPTEALVRIGRLGGLSRETVDACFADKALLQSVLKSRLDGAKKFNINSTPSFIINGEKLVGAQPFERFEKILNRLLSQS